MPRQGGCVQLEQSNMGQALDMAKMAKGGFSHTAIEETQYLIQKPRAEVQDKMLRGVEFPGHKKVWAAIERQPAMLCQNHMPGFLSCRNGTAKDSQTRCRRKGTGAPPPIRRRQNTLELPPEPTRPLPGTPPTSTANTSGAHCLKIINLPAGYAYSHISLPCAESFTLDSSAQHSEHDTDYDPDMLLNEGTSKGY